MNRTLGPGIHVLAITHGLEPSPHQVLGSQAMQVISNQTRPANIAFDSYHPKPTLFVFIIARTGDDMLPRSTV